MGRVLFAALLSTVFVWLGCAGEGQEPSTSGDTTPGAGVNFATQVQPVFDQSCSCHLTISAPQGTVLTSGMSYDFLVNVPSTEAPDVLRVRPGKPDESYLIIKIDDNVPDITSKRVGERMPRGLPPLGKAEVEVIRQWILEGAERVVEPSDVEPPRFNGATLAVAVSDTAIDVFWDSATDNETASGEIIYKVYMAEEPGAQGFEVPSWIVPDGGLTARVGGLASETRYYFIVRAQDASGNQDSNRAEVSAATLEPPPPPRAVDFERDVQPIFAENCLRCHTGFAGGTCFGTWELCLESYEAIEATTFDGRLIIPFDAAGSELVKRVRGESTPRMPFDGPPFLSEEQIALLVEWIDSGAKPATPLLDPVPPIPPPDDRTMAVLAAVYHRVCGECHSPDIPLSVPRSAQQWQSTVDRMVARYEAQLSAFDRRAAILYLNTVAQGESPETLPDSEARPYMNLVCSTCHSPSRVIDMETGLPREVFREFQSARSLTAFMMGQGAGLEGLTDVLVARWLSTVESPIPDILSIDRYEYYVEQRKLRIQAWSSQGETAVLRVTGDGGFDAFLQRGEGGEHSIVVTNVEVFPGRIVLTSSSGGYLKWQRKLDQVLR